MQLRCLHANSFSFEAQDHDPDSDARTGVSADLAGSVVAFVAVERSDADRSARVADAAADRITEMANRLAEQTVALVPCAQLADSPAVKSAAGDMIDDLADYLDFETHTAPIGKPVSFELDARGHPFANQRFEIDPAERANGEWFIVDSDGSLTEATADRTVLDDGQVVDLMPFDRLASPSGGGPILFDEDGRVLPEGVFLRDLVTDLATDRLREYGAVAVRPPRGGDSKTVVTSGSEPPRSVFEISSETQDRRHELRLTTTVPTQKETLVEADAQIDLVSELLAALSVPFGPVCHVTESFFDEHRDWLATLAGQFEQPLLLERHTESDSPFTLEFAVVDEYSQLVVPTVWIDNSTTTGADDTIIVRSAPLGDPIRFIAALCRTTAEAERPQLPAWLAPVQLRLIPLEPTDIEACDRVAERLESADIRVDIDDRDLPVSERLDTADEEWIPYDAVIGAEDDETLRVTARAEQTERECEPAELAEQISEESADWPGGTRPVPRRYSDRPDVLRDTNRNGQTRP